MMINPFHPPVRVLARQWQAAKQQPTSFGDKKNRPRRNINENDINPNRCYEMHATVEGRGNIATKPNER